MQFRLFFILALFIPSMAFTQIRIMEPDNLGVDVQNTTLIVDTPVLTSTQGNYEEEYLLSLWLVNDGDSIDLTIRRFELDVCPNSSNATPWVVSPPFVDAGTTPIYNDLYYLTLAPNDTTSNFQAYYRTTDTTCCSAFLYEWLDVNNNDSIVASVNVLFMPQGSICYWNIDEQVDELEIEIYPNPANQSIVVNNLGTSPHYQRSIQIMNMLGEKVKEASLGALDSSINLDVNELPSGVYLVSVLYNGKIVGTKKLVVKP